MRADRLISLMLLLQTRGRMTARQLAEELEVTERTIYRDVDALSVSGIPIYGESGPDGGYELLESYRSSLTGLTDDETRALFLLSLPSPLSDLGIDQQLKSALLKLHASSPDAAVRMQAEVHQRILVDPTWWDVGETPRSLLAVVQQAVWQEQMLHIQYRVWSLPGGEIDRIVEPYALVAKAGVWHLLYRYGDQFHVQSITELLAAHLEDASFARQSDFDLTVFWDEWSRIRKEYRSSYPVTVRVSSRLAPVLTYYFDTQPNSNIGYLMAQKEYSTPGAEWFEIQLEFASLPAARDAILRCGSGIEVLEPYALRRSVQDFAEQILSVYNDD